MLFSFAFALAVCALWIFRLFFRHFICFFDLTRPQRCPSAHTMCGNNFSIIVKFFFIFSTRSIAYPSIFVWHLWLFTSPAAKMQFMCWERVSFGVVLVLFYFRSPFACLCFFFQFFHFIFWDSLLFWMLARVRLLAVVICVWFTFIVSSQACNFLIATDKWGGNFQSHDSIFGGFIVRFFCGV